MWDFLLWLFYRVDWTIQVIILLGIYGIGLVVVGNLFGWELARKLAWPIIAVIGALAFLARARQQGYADRKVEEKRVNDKLVDEFKDIHEKDEGLSDAELDKKNDPWIKP